MNKKMVLRNFQHLNRKHNTVYKKRMSYLAPLNTIVQARPISTPEKWINLSSQIIISSISLQCPSLTDSGLSKVDAISPPVTKARRSIPSKSACSIARIPASANNSYRKL